MLSEKPPPWSELEALLPFETISRLGEHRNSRLIGPRRFFEWTLSSDDDAEWLRSFMRCSNRDVIDHLDIGRVHAVIQKWTDIALSEAIWKSTTVRGMRNAVIDMFNDVNSKFPWLLPSIDSALLHVGAPVDQENHRALGELAWEEFESVEPARRDAVGINLLRTEYLRLFDDYENVYRFGQDLLQTPRPSRSAPEAWKALKSILEDEVRCWSVSGRSQFSVKWSEELKAKMLLLDNQGVWKSLGLESTILSDSKASNAAPLIVAMLGPVPAACRAVQGVFSCDTGWNRTPIQRLSVDPFAFRSEKQVYLGSAEVLATFKERAGHFVFAQPETSLIVRGLATLNLTSVWNDVAGELNLGRNDEQAALEVDGELLGLMNRLQAMQANLRRWEGASTRGLMFACLNHRGAGVRLSVRCLNEGMPSEILMRPNVTYSAIRKSFLNSLSTAGFEPRMITEIAGQRSNQILQRNYIVGSQAVRTYEQPMRFFQGCLQELALSAHTAIRLRIPAENREWFRMFANLTGITAACSMTTLELEGEVDDDFTLTPTPENLGDLALVHMGVKSQRLQIPHQRWEIQGTVVLGLIKALGRTVISMGLRREYWAAARKVRRELVAGSVTLPLLLEI